MEAHLKPINVVLTFVILLGITACAATWGAVAARWLSGRPVLPYRPRRRVPWRLGDVAVVALLFVLLPNLLWQVWRHWTPPPAPTQQAEVVKTPPRDIRHPVERVLLEDRDTATVLTCVLLVVVIAPVAEEMVFRLVLQGWLESLERRLRRRVAPLRGVTAGVLPVGLTSLAFAALHIRGAAPPKDVSETVFAMAIQYIAWLAAIALAVCWLRFAVGATAADLGVAPPGLAGDVRLGMIAFLAVTVPVLALNWAAHALLPDAVVDPIPLLLLAVVLGTVYYRTHRILPCIVLHAAFNAVGVAIAFLAP
jgi:membrane protease YdiL (CAAX protease family)